MSLNLPDYQKFNLLTAETPGDILQNIATKDLGSNAIQESLLSASAFSKEQVLDFVTKRLTLSNKEQPVISFYEPIKPCRATRVDNVFDQSAGRVKIAR